MNEESDTTTGGSDRASRSMGAIAELLGRRPELRGVYSAADLTDDAIRWSA